MTDRGDQDRGFPVTLPALEHLPADQARDLFELMRAAATFEAATLDRSIDSMVSALPRPLRRMTKTIMFGGR
ncbi:hypothetical protein [Nocardia lasii]|uniref:FXSXX-COOH protein n=1 Tax=Nocardia lasii TaxID=1616107 RepID=A0ABW1JWV1_9NOCA